LNWRGQATLRHHQEHECEKEDNCSLHGDVLRRVLGSKNSGK
jgi:hypothetical protein